MNKTVKIAFFDELAKIAIAPILGAVGLDVGLAAVEGGHGAYKAIRHGKADLSTKLPYNPGYGGYWLATKGLHSGSSRWANDPNRWKRGVGRAGLATSKLMDATMQIDPVNAVGGMVHSHLRGVHKKNQEALAAARERGRLAAQKGLPARPGIAPRSV